tara:strand:- start:24192 stop:24470 length:279 start_codon:yes stop_codon:yes gene_type:complete
MSDNMPYPAGYGLHPNERKSWKTFKDGLTNLVFNQHLQTFKLDLAELYKLSGLRSNHAMEILFDQMDALNKQNNQITNEMSNIILDFSVSLS